MIPNGRDKIKQREQKLHKITLIDPTQPNIFE
jgi:hypothetical protein